MGEHHFGKCVDYVKVVYTGWELLETKWNWENKNLLQISAKTFLTVVFKQSWNRAAGNIGTIMWLLNLV